MIRKETGASIPVSAPFKSTSDDQIIAEIEKNGREVYRVIARTYKGHRLVEVRVWFDDPTTSELRPGKGVSLKLEKLPEIISALQSALPASHSNGART